MRRFSGLDSLGSRVVRRCAALLATLLVMQAAHATPGAAVVGGRAPDDQQATVRTATEQAIRDAGWTIPATPISKAEATALLRCAESTTPWTCVAEARGKRDLERVLLVKVDAKTGDDGSPILVLVGKLVAVTPGSAVVRQRFCEHCADDKLASEASSLASQMLREHAIRSGRTVVAIKSEPPGAQIILDGERIGATSNTYNTYPGKHVVVLEKAGYASETREFTAEEGRSSEVSVTLRASAASEGAPASPSDQRPSRLVPALVLGAGVVALGAGITLQVTKDGPPLGEPQPARIYSGPGIGLTLAGAALAGVGTYLWIRASRAPTSAPALALTQGGGTLGWVVHY